MVGYAVSQLLDLVHARGDPVPRNLDPFPLATGECERLYRVGKGAVKVRNP